MLAFDDEPSEVPSVASVSRYAALVIRYSTCRCQHYRHRSPSWNTDRRSIDWPRLRLHVDRLRRLLRHVHRPDRYRGNGHRRGDPGGVAEQLIDAAAEQETGEGATD